MTGRSCIKPAPQSPLGGLSQLGADGQNLGTTSGRPPRWQFRPLSGCTRSNVTRIWDRHLGGGRHCGQTMPRQRMARDESSVRLAHRLTHHLKSQQIADGARQSGARRRDDLPCRDGWNVPVGCCIRRATMLSNETHPYIRVGPVFGRVCQAGGRMITVSLAGRCRSLDHEGDPLDRLERHAERSRGSAQSRLLTARITAPTSACWTGQQCPTRYRAAAMGATRRS
jgi:hypothetical protein